MFRYQYILLVLVLFAIGCNHTNERVVETWDNGKPKVKKFFYNHTDTFSFRLTEHYPNGTVKKLTHIVDKVAHGWDINYYHNGSAKDSVFMFDNIPFSQSRHYHENGSLKARGSYNDSGNREGDWNFYDSLGKLKEVTEYSDGFPRGTTQNFAPNGNIVKKIIRFSEGQTKEIIHYKNNQRHGEYQKFNFDGICTLSGKYKNGTKVGTQWTIYYDNGKRFQEIKYLKENGFFDLINLWNRTGKQTVSNGNGYHQYLSYCLDGKVQSQITDTYINGQKTKSNEKDIRLCR